MPATAAVANRTVIVADDTAFVRDRFKAALEGAGHRAHTVRTAAELLDRVRTDAAQIDLIVLDLRLSHARGTDLIRALRRLSPSHPPIVVFSGTIANAAEVRELASLSVSGYVNEYTATQHIIPSLAPHLALEKHNRRSSPRTVLGIPVSYRFGNTIAAALTLNISRGGVAIRTTSPLPSGTELKVRFRLPKASKDIDADGRVTWSNRGIGMGVQFTRLAADDQTSIDEFVHAHFFTNRKA